MDTRYLRRRSGVWHVDLRIPTFLSDGPDERRFRTSLETADYKAAARFRDKYIVPLLREERERDVLLALLHDIQRCSARTIELTEELLAQFDLSIAGSGQLLIRESETAPLRELADAYLEYLRASDLALASIRKYQSTLNALCAILGDDADAEALSTADIVIFRDTLAQMPVGWQKRGEIVHIQTGHSQRSTGLGSGSQREPTLTHLTEAANEFPCVLGGHLDRCLTQSRQPLNKPLAGVGTVSVFRRFPLQELLLHGIKLTLHLPIIHEVQLTESVDEVDEPVQGLLMD